MSSFCPSFYRQHGFILIPFYAAPLYLALGQFTTRAAAEGPRGGGSRARPWLRAGDARLGPRLQAAAQGRSAPRMLTMGCLAYDAGEGEVRLGAARARGGVARDERGDRGALVAAIEAMGRIYAALGGEMFLDAYRERGTVHTSHPLGGCRDGRARRAARRGRLNGETFATAEPVRGRRSHHSVGAVREPEPHHRRGGRAIAGGLLAGQGLRSLRDRLQA